MSFESDLYTVLYAICPRVYPDVAPEGTTAPWVTWQQVGGEAIQYLGREFPDKRNGVMQINVWSTTRLEVNTIAQQIEHALTLSTSFQAKPFGAFVATYEPETQLFGALQRFSVWGSMEIPN